MDEHLKNAIEELKRVDHLIYVSLKYTRTVDVIHNVIERLINSFDFILNALLQKAVDEEKIESIPNAPMLKCEEIEKLYPDDEIILASVKRYLLLRRVVKSDYERECEYRRHVAMVSNIDGQIFKYDIDKVTECYKNLKELIDYIQDRYFKK